MTSPSDNRAVTWDNALSTNRLHAHYILARWTNMDGNKAAMVVAIRDIKYFKQRRTLGIRSTYTSEWCP